PCTLHVTGFRGSTVNGFIASFSPYYTLVTEHADLTLGFEILSLEITPEQRMILRYAAHLEDSQGKTLGRSFDSLPPRRLSSADQHGRLPAALGKMFEKIAADCFAPLSTARSN